MQVEIGKPPNFEQKEAGILLIFNQIIENFKLIKNIEYINLYKLFLKLKLRFTFHRN